MPAATRRKTNATRGSGTLKQLRIRMYNVGFGDCILLLFTFDDGERTMLVDCGAHPSGVANPMPNITKDLVATVTRNGTARIDIVVASHRHFDHISGFDMKIWEDVQVGEVWMPWTEERGVPAADKLRRSQNRVAAMLSARFPSNATPMGWLAMNSLSNRGAEDTLLSGFAGKPARRYLPAFQRADRSFTTPLLPGLKVHALGPSHDAKIIATLDPPKGKYFPLPPKDDAAGPAAVPGGRVTERQVNRIFPDRYRLSPTEYNASYPRLADHADIEEVRHRAEADFLGTAAALEDAINGTSLVLAVEIGDRCLLLGGDAEWGPWSEILEDPEWAELLKRTLVYKVSHHGSYNGTPKPFVDDVLPSDAVSLVSLRAIDHWPSIPRTTLLDALRTGKRTVVRTDDIPAESTTITRNGDLWVEVDIPLT